MTDRSSRVTEEDISFFQTQGYIRYEGFFSAEKMDELRDAVDRAIARNRERIRGAAGGGRVSEDYERVFNQMVNLWTDVPAAKTFAFHHDLAEAGRRLSGCRHVRIYHDHAMVKPPGQTSRATNWHQDAPYWRMDPVGSFSAWIAVDDVTVDNGCLHFVPGSHRYGRQEPISLTTEGESIIDRMREQGFSVAEPVSMEMAAGGVTFHHGCTFHYAGPNLTGTPRRAFAIIYIPDHVTFTGGNDAAGAAEEMTAGGPWDHPVHPILAGDP